MPKILFIKNLEELDYIERHSKHLFSTHKIITISSLVWIRLRAQGLAIEHASDYLLAEDFNNIMNGARLFSNEWYKPFEHLLYYKGFNLGELIRFEQIWFFRELIASVLTIQRIIERYRPEGISLFVNLDTPNLGASQYDGTSDIFSAVMLWTCENNKMSVHKLFFNQKIIDRSWSRLKRKITRHLPYVLFLYRYLKRLAENISYRNNPYRIPLTSFLKSPCKKLSIALGNCLELHILEKVMKTLSSLKGFDVAFLSIGPIFDTVYLNNRSGLEIDSGFKFVCLDDFRHSVFPEDLEIIRSLKKARRIFDSGIAINSESLPRSLCEILKNPYLAVQFDFVWGDYFFEAVSMIDNLYKVYRLWNPDVVLVANAVGYTQRIFVKLARKFKAKSITAPHGWVADTDHYNFESDLFLAWGDLSKAQLMEKCNKTSKNIAVVGAVQFEKIIPSPKGIGDDIAKSTREEIGFRLDAKVVLIITAGVPQSAFSDIDMKKFLQSWESVKIFIKEHPEIDFIIRPHPTEELISWYRQLVSDFNRPNLKIMESKRLESFLPAVDAGILFGQATTACYLCILFEVPVIIFRHFMKATMFNTIEAWNSDSGLLIVDKESDLTNLIMRLLNDGNFRGETLKKEQIFLDKSLLVRDRKVGERIIKGIKELCAR